MITRSSIAFEDFLGSSIAPQVMPPCIKVTNENLVKTKLAKNPHNDLCGNNAWERNTEMKIASGIVQMLDGIDDEFAR